MGYLICVKCGGYYELQPGEKPEDFSNECKCGGELIYSESLDFTEENNEDNLQHDEYDYSYDEDNLQYDEDNPPVDEEELPIKQSKTLEDYKATLEDKSRMKQIKLATEFQEILETKGKYVIKADGNTRSIKIIDTGIETDEGQFIKFEDIVDIEFNEDVIAKQETGQEKSRIGALVETGYQIFAPRKVTLIIKLDKGRIELNDVKRSDANKLISFVNWKLNKVKIGN